MASAKSELLSEYAELGSAFTEKSNLSTPASLERAQKLAFKKFELMIAA